MFVYCTEDCELSEQFVFERVKMADKLKKTTYSLCWFQKVRNLICFWLKEDKMLTEIFQPANCVRCKCIH